MHCPNCATENPEQHKYCRSCGMQLNLVSAMVAHHRNRSGPLKPARSEEELTFRIVKLIAGSFLTLAFGLLVALAGPRFSSQEFVPTVGGFIFLAGMVVFLFACFRLAWLKAKPPGAPRMHQATTQPDLQTPDAALLAPPIPSITESTTKLIDDVPEASPPQQSSRHQTG